MDYMILIVFLKYNKTKVQFYVNYKHYIIILFYEFISCILTI